VKALLPSPSMRQVLEVSVRRAAAQEENLDERLRERMKEFVRGS
jgi:hypothetical protein